MTHEELAKGNEINNLISELEDDIRLLDIAKNKDCSLRVQFSSTHGMLKLGNQERSMVISILLGAKSTKLEELKKEFKNL